MIFNHTLVHRKPYFFSVRLLLVLFTINSYSCHLRSISNPSDKGQVASRPPQNSTLEQDFASPPIQARPWVFWMWLNTPSQPESITRDLEEMKAKGIVGCILYSTGAGQEMQTKTRMVPADKSWIQVPTDDYEGAYQTPLPYMAPWSPEWRKEVRFASKTAGKLGVKLCLTVGLAGTSGPIKEEYGLQALRWSACAVSGPQVFDSTLSLPAVSHLPPGAAKAPYHRDLALLAWPDKKVIQAGDIIDLSSELDSTGHFHWDVPPGKWRIVRFSQVATLNANAWGYRTDYLSAEAMDTTWAATIGVLLGEMTPEERKGLTAVEDDSYEGGDGTWTKTFPTEFKKRRGYDLMSYLPVLMGQKMVDSAYSAHIMRDYKLTISDLIADNHYGRLSELAHRNNLRCFAEAAGPHLHQADELKTGSKVDKQMGEFWMPSPHRPTVDSRFYARDAATSNHIYGHPETMCESFTSVGPHWEETPFLMKQTADQAFCDGVNRICFHEFSHSPWASAKPGAVYFAGTHYNRNITWWDETPAFNTYLARCSYMLQQGKFTADVLFYQGDGIGTTMPRKVEMPGLGQGYDFDRCNSDVILNRMSVKKGHIILPDGMTYQVLALPRNEPMALNVLKKIASLVEAGATVVGPAPAGMANRPLHSRDEIIFNRLIDRLWPQANGEANVGKGHVVSDKTVREVLEKEGVLPDFVYSGLSPKGEIDWIHRTEKNAEIYYVASRWFAPEKISCSFRISGRQPELWDPVTGNIRPATAFRQEKGRTIIPLEFNPCGSVFVVFRKPVSPIASGTSTSNYPRLEPFQNITGPWKVSFDTAWGGPNHDVIFSKLSDWTARPEKGIKFYSGKATYKKNFDLMAVKSGQRIFLDLGDVREIANVRLNGVDLGTIWTKPARVDITDIIKTKDNQLEVDVVNLWPNRLIGDSFLPPEKRFTKTNFYKFTPATPLLPSGLIGPVILYAAKPQLPTH